MPIYDISGNEIVPDFPEQVTLQRNSEELVTEFLTVAQSYLNQTSLTYADGETIFYDKTKMNGIDCSTYVGLCMMGYPFEETPYYTRVPKDIDAWEENPDYDWSVATIRYTASRWIDGHNPDERLRLACQFARWMTDRGQLVPMKDGFRDVMPGDIVFWGHRRQSTGEWIRPDWYLHINHIGIVLTRELAPDTYTYTESGTTYTIPWNKSKYPFKHQIIEVTDVTPPCTTQNILEKGQESTSKIYVNNVNTIVAICRPDLGALKGETTP